MNRLLLLLSGCVALYAGAPELNFHDFENNSVGDVFTMKNIGGGEVNATATVAVDKTNADNKVLSVSCKSWDTYVEFPLPDGITGQNFCDNFQTLEFDLYRLESSNDDYMNFVVKLGDDVLYSDEGYPNQGNEETWQRGRSYKLKNVKNNATVLYIGLHNDKADYYLDNIRLSGMPSQSTGTVTWTGSVSDVWDMATTANFTDGTAATVFNEGNSAIFNDDPGAHQTVNLAGSIRAYDVTFNNNRHAYTLLPGEAGAKLTGRGSLTVDNGAVVKIGVANELEGGTNLKNGCLKLASVNDVAGFGKQINVTEGTLDFCFNNTDKSYLNLQAPIMLNGKTLDVYTSRYTNWTSTVSGTGDINVYCGGERSYMGDQKNKVTPDWSNFSGTVTVYPYKEAISTAGFYGLVFEANKSDFKPDECNISRSNQVFKNCKVVVTDGAALACDGNGLRGVTIGDLELEEGSRLYGYIKASASARTYFVIGLTDNDGLLAGRMCPQEKDGKVLAGQELGIIKRGNGTYTITNNTNCLSGGLKVDGGKVLVNNDAEAARAGKLTGGTGSTAGTIYVGTNGILGGSGNIAGYVNVYGTVQPGNDNIGTLTFADFATDEQVTVCLRPTARFEIELGAAGNDVINIAGPISFYNQTEDFEESDKMPVVKLTVGPDAAVKSGDEFTVVTAKSKESLDEITKWSFALDAPEGWRLEERESAEGYSVVLVAANPASIENVTDRSGFEAYVAGDNLYVNAPEGDIVNIYTPDGKLLNSLTASAGTDTVPVNGMDGVIIVNCGTQSVKLTVK